MCLEIRFAAAAAALLLSGVASAATPLVFLVTGNPAGGRPIVEGTTNLPDGTELLLTISRKANGYRGQDKFKVQGGKFKSTQFTNHGAAFIPGKYVLEVVGPLASVQPAPVRAVIGDNYSNFSSPLIKRGSMGTTLRYEAPLVIPGQSNSAADLAARKQAEQDKAAWLRKSCTEIPGIAERLSQYCSVN